MLNFTIGSDPEAFIMNNASSLIVSSKRFTEGTKDEPENLGDGYAILNDNILIEGNVPPAKSKEEFVENMTKLWKIMDDKAGERMAHLHNVDCMQIHDTLLDTPEAQEFGCSAFRDAWNDLIEIATPQLNGNMRPAGCHIHLGFDGAHRTDSFRIAVVRAFDMLVTLPAIEITGMNYRTSNLYGILGACRITSYGIECRSLGGTFFDPKYFEWIYDKVKQAINLAETWEEALITLPNIYTLVGAERIELVKQFKAVFEEANVLAV